MDTITPFDEALVDWEVHARTRAQLGAAFVRILGYFREDGDKSVARIEDAMQRKDATGLVLPAHTIKTEARQFGAEPLGALAEEIEHEARSAIEMHFFPDHLIPQVARLRPLYLQTIDLLERDANPLRQRSSAGPGAA
ncbi:Hpt domain-containing protein [Allosphingosinicella deserti]|uniref:Hpt domain-containing protein n=1 Tax=Allosphingosinicella deserti TaxID=2116704 RepID=UPI001E4F0D13|nr:Hpt domain-containing protein [Sphingomonas deserti]